MSEARNTSHLQRLEELLRNRSIWADEPATGSDDSRLELDEPTSRGEEVSRQLGRVTLELDTTAK